MSTLNVIEHPLITHKISMLRNEETGSKEFRELVSEVAALICYEATRDLKLSNVNIKTPLGNADVEMLSEQKYAVVPVLRAGIGMVDGMLQLMPTAKVGHIGLYRDPETLLPVEYYCKMPSDINEREVFIVDPMLATGGTAVAAIDFMKEKNVKKIKLLCLISSPEGVKNVQNNHPEVEIYTAALDEGLNSHGYIIPGLGDAGDRLFGTK